jgi:hypothetical protein
VPPAPRVRPRRSRNRESPNGDDMLLLSPRNVRARCLLAISLPCLWRIRARSPRLGCENAREEDEDPTCRVVYSHHGWKWDVLRRATIRRKL